MAYKIAVCNDSNADSSYVAQLVDKWAKNRCDHGKTGMSKQRSTADG